jgi:hypothetical protein
MATNGSAVEQNEPVNANGKLRVIPAGIIGPLESDVVALLEALQVPFDAGLVKWRANETKFVDRKLQGFCLPYADPRAYKDRLNILLSPIKWRDRYAITTTAAKILVTCELQIDCLGCHSATGEEWSRNENATTAAEAQAFKRACSGFGLGRYFYHFTGVWLPLDKQKRPTSNPQLPAWATPDGWKGGLRPPINVVTEPQPETAPDTALNSPEREAAGATEPTRPTKNVVQELRAMESVIGARLYRGLLKTVAHVWDPTHIRNLGLQRKVLEHMKAAHRGLHRVQAALRKLDESVSREIFNSLELNSYTEISDLHTLQQLLTALERAAGAIA